MATYTVIERPPEGGINEKGERHYVRSFQVTSSNPLDGAARITRAIPYTLYEAYPFAGEEDPYAILKSVDSRPTDCLGVWDVTLNYDSAQNRIDRGASQPGKGADGTQQPRPGQTPSEAGQGSNEKSPENRPWVIKWTGVKTTKLLQVDRSPGMAAAVEIIPVEGPLANPIVVNHPATKGKPVVNSAGQPFDPPLEVPDWHAVVHITAFFPIANYRNIRKYLGKVNKSPWMGWPKGCAVCTGYSITSVYEQGKWFWEVQIEVEFNDEGWNPVKVLDCGTMYIDADIGREARKLRPIVDPVTGQPVTHPVPLNGFGQPLKAGEPFVYLKFQGYDEADFRNILNQKPTRRRRA